MPAVREISIDLHELLHGPAAVPNDGAVYAALAVQSRSVLGEGVIYDDRANAVMWTDILGSVLHKLDLNQQSKSKARFSTHEMPTKLGSFGLLQAESGYGSLPILCAWDNGFQIYDVENERSLSEKSTGEDVNPAKGATRLNDGRTDPTGRRFICGGYNGGEKGTTMKVFRVEQFEGKLFHESIVDSIEVANSIAFSPDGKSMYLADSPTKQIHVYDYHGETLSNKKLVYDMTDAQVGVPDGSCVDSEGMIWNAVWRNGAGPGMVQRIHPVSPSKQPVFASSIVSHLSTFSNLLRSRRER